MLFEAQQRLESKLDGFALRVPTPTVSLADFTALVERPPASAEEVNHALRTAAADAMRDVLGVMDVPLVSIDFTGDPHSSVVDAHATMVQGELVKTALWYDNEWGYACRVADMTFYMTQRAQGRSHEEVRADMIERAPHFAAPKEVVA